MPTIEELDPVVLMRALPALGLTPGDIGTVVHRYTDASTLEVEFVTGAGETVAVVTLPRENVRLMEPNEMLHARVRTTAS